MVVSAAVTRKASFAQAESTLAPNLKLIIALFAPFSSCTPRVRKQQIDQS